MRLHFMRLFILSIMPFFFLSCQAEREVYSPLFKCSKKLDGAYGVCTHINRVGPRYEYDTREQDLSMIDNVGATWLRADWDLPTLQENGKYVSIFGHYDKMMGSVNAHNKYIFGIMSLNSSFKMSDIEKWEKHVSQVAAHYKKYVIHWEIINEVDIIQQWRPGIYAMDYVKLLKKGYTAIKSQNKKAIVLFSGIANTDNTFVDSVFSENVSDYFDVMTVHRYTYKKTEPETFLDYYLRLHKKLLKYGIDKPVWLTETGGSTMSGIIDEQTQAIRLPRIFLISFACGIDKVFWYKSRARELNPTDVNDFYGLWHKDYTPKPAFYSYRTLTNMCPDKSVRPKLSRVGNVYLAHWKRPDGKNVYAIWTAQNKEIVKIYTNGKYESFDVYCNQILSGDSMIEASPSILYYVGGEDFQFSILEK